MVSACLDGGKSLAGHDSPSARYLVPGLDLKPVFVDCTRIRDFCFSQRQLKHAKLVLQKKKKKNTKHVHSSNITQRAETCQSLTQRGA